MNNKTKKDKKSSDSFYLGFAAFLIIPYFASLIIVKVIRPFISLIPETLEFLAFSAKHDWLIISPFIIPLFWLLTRQISILLAQSLVLHLGFPLIGTNVSIKLSVVSSVS
tara:strand:- start:2 stop:331 length:330 start_codon:yes stop_codon:yes gene_type:complete